MRPADTIVRRSPDLDCRIPWIFSKAFDDLVARSFGIPSDTQAASTMPTDPLPFLHYPIPRRPTAATDTFVIHARVVTPPRRPDQSGPYLDAAEPGLLPRTYDQDSVVDDAPFFSSNIRILQTAWDAGPPSIVPHTYYDWQEPQHQDGLPTAPIGDAPQQTGSSSTLTSGGEVAPPVSQTGAQRRTKSSRARSSNGRFPCEKCGTSLTRNWTLQRHRKNSCPGPGGKRGRKPFKAPRKFDNMD
jgi:hypothetical protein